MRRQNASVPEARVSVSRAPSWLVRPIVHPMSIPIVGLCGAIARRGMPWRKHNLIGVLAWTMTVFGLAQGKSTFIRPIDVYEGLIKEMHDYFNNTCIIILHAYENPTDTQELIKSDNLMFLQKYLSMKFFIRTTVMDFHKFRTRVGHRYYHIKRPLFVILNDHEDTRSEFVNVTTWIAMAYPTWLVFFDNETDIEKFFLGVYVPFDCKFMVARSSPNGSEIITEVYQIDKEKELKSMQFGLWDRRNGLKTPTRGLYQRRNDLYGQNIRVASVHDPPISLFHRNKHMEIIGISGFFGEVIMLLQEAINCTFTYKEAKSWGTCLPNGTCTGAIGMLMNNEVDFAATEFMMTSDRLDVISFTTPIYTTKCRTYIKRPVIANLKWEAYTAPFSALTWNVIIFFMALMSVSIVFIQKSVARTSVHLKVDNRMPSRFTELFFHITGAFCGQGMDQSTLDPVRIVHFVAHMTAVVILAAYSASLISFLAISTFVMPFTTMDGLLNDGRYRFSVIGDSADFSFFQNTSDKIIKVLFDQLLMKETNLPANYLDGLQRVCKEDKYAFMVLDNMAAILQQKVDCKLEPLDVITHTTIAMALQTNSPYRGIIDSNILTLKDGGILQRLLQTQWSQLQSQTKSTWKSVEIGDIMPLLLLMTIAVIVSCVLYTMEVTVRKKSRKRTQSKSNKLWQLKM